MRFQLLLLSVLAGCYASHLPGEGDACLLPEELLTDTRGMGDGTRCVLSGISDEGVVYEMDCTTEGCSLRVDGIPTCECNPSEIDFANVCPNEVPTCSTWRIFDWTNLEWEDG